VDVQVLSPDVASRIAAGEVIERPASVVKELVENALDAGASRIDIECRAGGVEFICVADDGAGIPASQAELAFERHATSKIRTLDDLANVSSLGFRGEALPSIAAVADVELSTRPVGQEAGIFVYLHAGKVAHRESRPRAVGTTVAVRRLFMHVPARLKFLKSEGTENSHSAQVVTQYALAYPSVAFSLMLEDRLALRSPGNGALRDVVAGIYGIDVARSLVPVELSADGIRVSGLAGPASLSRSGRRHQSTFVNRRWVRSPLLQRAIEEAYRGLLLGDRNPVAFIDISLPASLVDVNVHPSKAQVKFADEQRVFRCVRDAVAAAVRNTPVATPAWHVMQSPREVTPTMRTVAETGPLPFSSPAPTIATTGTDMLPPLRVLGQVRATYILAEGPDGLYVIDQHAAHERVVYDRLSQRRGDTTPDVQGLLEPVTIELSPVESVTISHLMDDLRRLGFDLEPFGDRSYLLRSIPAPLAGVDAEGALHRILQDMGTETAAKRSRDRLTESVACHASVRAGQQLSREEMYELIKSLERTTQPRTCPHGRPTVIVFDSPCLERLFARRV